MKKLIRFIAIILPLIYIMMIWKVSSMPSNTYVKFGFSFDDFIRESLHLIEFGLLFYFLLSAFWSLGKTSSKMEIVAIIIAITYGFIDELHQSYIPYRTASILDLIKDSTGVLVSYGLYRYCNNNQDSRLGKILHRFKGILMNND